MQGQLNELMKDRKGVEMFKGEWEVPEVPEHQLLWKIEGEVVDSARMRSMAMR